MSALDSGAVRLGVLAGIGGILLAVRQYRLKAGTERPDSPGSLKKKKRSTKPKSKKDKSDLDFAPPIGDLAVEAAAVRKAHSTVDANVVAWFKEQLEDLTAPLEAAEGAEGAAAPPVSDHFSVLSVGSGQGDVDMQLIRALYTSLKAGPTKRRLHYCALEPNQQSAQEFRQRIEKAKQNGELGSEAQETMAYVLENVFEDRQSKKDSGENEKATEQKKNKKKGGDSDQADKADKGGISVFKSNRQFDLVILAQVMPVFKDKMGAVQRALAQTKPGGRVVIVQESMAGIPEIQMELVRVLREHAKEKDTAPFTAEDMKRQMAGKMVFTQHTIEAHLDATECLKREGNGIKLMSSCMECDLRRIKEAKLMRVLKAFWRQAIINEQGQALIKTPALAFVVEKPLGKK